MATFECKVYKLKIEEHPNADALELAVVGDYRSIVRKGQFKSGDLGVYIPEAAIVPEWLIAELGLEGRLAGKDKNRVKAVKLRGILSQGLIVPVDPGTFDTPDGFIHNYSEPERNVVEGDVVTDYLGITKYDPPIPTSMNGEVFNAFGKTLKYDIENFKKYPTSLEEGEMVLMTEKIHGTWCCMGYHPDLNHPVVTSKGLSEKGLAFKFNEANAKNLYVQAFQRLIYRDVNEHPLFPMFLGTTVLDQLAAILGTEDPFYILGEVFGKGVQDLHYGADNPQFRVFDIYVGEPGHGHYIAAGELQAFCTALNLPMVPVVYLGPFSKEKMEEVTNGKEVVSGHESNIREGVVIKPIGERTDPELGRVVLKSVSEAYLLRKNATEFN